MTLEQSDNSRKCYFCQKYEYETDLFFDTSLKITVCENCLDKSQELDKQVFYKKLEENPFEVLGKYVPDSYINSCNEPFYHSKKDFVNEVLDKVLTLDGDTCIKGMNNTGKTKLIWICFIQLVLQKKLHPSAILVVKTYDLKNEYLLSVKNNVTFDIKKYLMIPMLFIDDLIASNLTPGLSSELFYILDYRWENRRPTMVTTDVSFEALIKCDQRIAARIARYSNKFQTDKSKIL